MKVAFGVIFISLNDAQFFPGTLCKYLSITIYVFPCNLMFYFIIVIIRATFQLICITMQLISITENNTLLMYYYFTCFVIYLYEIIFTSNKFLLFLVNISIVLYKTGDKITKG